MAQKNSLKIWPGCGSDTVINEVLQNLNSYPTKSLLIEARPVEILRKLFLRNAFDNIPHSEHIAEFIWVLRKTRSIIEYYQTKDMFGTYKNSIDAVISKIKKLEISSLEGLKNKAVKLEKGFRTYQHDHEKFVIYLGKWDPMPNEWIVNKNKEICELRRLLKNIGFIYTDC